MSIEELESQALGLPEREREHLVQRLIASLDDGGDLVEAWYEGAGGEDGSAEPGDAGFGWMGDEEGVEILGFDPEVYG